MQRVGVPLDIQCLGQRRSFTIGVYWRSHQVITIARRGESLRLTFWAHDPGAN